MVKIEAFAKIENGKLLLHNDKRLKADISTLPDQEVILTIKKRGSKSLAQTGYLFGVVYQECRLGFLNLGYRMSIEEVHRFFKIKFLPVHIMDSQGTIIGEWEGTTTDMNKAEMTDYIEQIRQYAAENLSVHIPDPVKNPKLF
jgi:hypothetical protein